uniref:Proline-rich transmembrane protein 3 n=1 Tax=Lygus hesperus TaxID=30085 RepID=A0A0A9Z511_LYGHE
MECVRASLRSRFKMRPVMFFAMAMLFGFANSEESFVSVMASDRRVLDSEPSEVFNKTLASKDKSNFLRGPRTPPTPPTRVIPSYSPPNRMSFTPPLPPQFAHPFENKPILRGSNSDSVSVANRRPIPPPPFRMSQEELIPIRPPDLVPHDSKKKTLNTPSFKKVADASTYSETSSTTTSNARNETFDFVPILPYPSVSRILSGGSGRKPDSLQDILERTRLEHDKEPRTIKQDKAKTMLQPPVKPEIDKPDDGGAFSEPKETPPQVRREPELEKPKERPAPPRGEDPEPTDPPPKWGEEARKQEISNGGGGDVESEVAPQPERPEPRTRHVLGIAWDIHVYLIAVLFAILALCSLINIIRLMYYKHLLSQGYFLSVHGILLVIGCMRSFYLFYDAYNINKSLPVPISNLLMHMVFPLLTSAFAILFLFLLTATEVKAMNNRIQRVSILTIFIVLHLAASFAIHYYANDTPYSVLLPLICQCVFIILCVGLGLAYLYLYKSLSQSCVQKASHMYCSEGERWSLAHAVRVTLATAMLSLLMAAVHLYGMLGDYEGLTKDRQQPWLWWGFQLSVRVIEISMCALLAWAGMQRDSTALPEQPASVEDIYPAICTANQAYTMRSAKHYDDTFPLNSLHHAHTAERRSIKKHPSLDRRLQPSPSMLVAENGFVRFRTIADAELPDDTYTTANSIHEFA